MGLHVKARYFAAYSANQQVRFQALTGVDLLLVWAKTPGSHITVIMLLAN